MSVKDICSEDQKSMLTCPHNRVLFNASAVWCVHSPRFFLQRLMIAVWRFCRGLIGPTRQFGKGALYHGHLWGLLVGVLLPLPFWWWQRRFPKTRLKYINIPVLLNGATFIPPATGINYSSWFVTGFIFRESPPPHPLVYLVGSRKLTSRAQSTSFAGAASSGGPSSTTSSPPHSTRGRCLVSSLSSSPFRCLRMPRSPSIGGGTVHRLTVCPLQTSSCGG
jgi:hypothetical protein